MPRAVSRDGPRRFAVVLRFQENCIAFVAQAHCPGAVLKRAHVGANHIRDAADRLNISRDFGDDKKRARLNIITHLLSMIPYKKVPLPKVNLPKRQKPSGYKESDYPYKMVPEKY